jgi:peptidoglycan hydrolase-like protein with peptidoglycan-binding domain
MDPTSLDTTRFRAWWKVAVRGSVALGVINLRLSRFATPGRSGAIGTVEPAISSNLLASILYLCWLLVVAAALICFLAAVLAPGAAPPDPVPAPSKPLEVVGEPELPRPVLEDVPETGIGSQLTQANARYCLFQQVRLEAVGPLTAKTDLTIYGSLVNDWNSRCALARYQLSDQISVNAEILDRRAGLEAEGLAIMSVWRRKLQATSQDSTLGSRTLRPSYPAISPVPDSIGIPPTVARPQPSTSLPSLITGQPTPSLSEADSGPLKAPTLMLLHAYVAARVQKRLSELGYASSPWDGTWGPMSRSALRRFKQVNGLLWDDAFDAETAARLFSTSALSAPAQPSPTEEGLIETAYPPPPGARLNPLNRLDCERIQRRLIDLGYFLGSTDGLWGAASRGALRAFKGANGLAQDDEWDGPTETVMNDERAIRALSAPCSAWKANHDESPVKLGRNEEARTGCDARSYGNAAAPAGEFTGSTASKPSVRPAATPLPDKRAASMLTRDAQKPLTILPVPSPK